MPVCKNTPRKRYTGKENTPLGKGYSASAEKVGKKMKGKNGKTYVATRVKGGMRWVPVNGKHVSPRMWFSKKSKIPQDTAENIIDDYEQAVEEDNVEVQEGLRPAVRELVREGYLPPEEGFGDYDYTKMRDMDQEEGLPRGIFYNAPIRDIYGHDEENREWYISLTPEERKVVDEELSPLMQTVFRNRDNYKLDGGLDPGFDDEDKGFQQDLYRYYRGGYPEYQPGESDNPREFHKTVAENFSKQGNYVKKYSRDR